MGSTEIIDTNLFIITEFEQGVRLDKFLKIKFPEYSRTYFQYLIEEGLVLINGRPQKKRYFIEKGDEIEVFFSKAPAIDLTPEPIPLDILFEDEHIIAINKPPGMVVHPAPGNWSGTFVNALLSHCQDLCVVDDELRPGIVHRLDKDTSGVLLAAKTRVAHQKLIEAFSGRKMEKHYLAITQNKPKSGTISLPIKRHPTKRKEMCVSSAGKEAVSDISIVAYNDSLSIVLIKPKTGRTHQIRVHLKALNAPVLGDETYGSELTGKKYGATRQLLHAHKLIFSHPISKEPMTIVAPLPADMKRIAKVNFFAGIN